MKNAWSVMRSKMYVGALVIAVHFLARFKSDSEGNHQDSHKYFWHHYNSHTFNTCAHFLLENLALVHVLFKSTVTGGKFATAAPHVVEVSTVISCCDMSRSTDHSVEQQLKGTHNALQCIVLLLDRWTLHVCRSQISSSSNPTIFFEEVERTCVGRELYCHIVSVAIQSQKVPLKTPLASTAPHIGVYIFKREFGDDFGGTFMHLNRHPVRPR